MEGVLVEEEVVLVALAVVAVLAGLLLEVGFQNQSAQQAELPTAHCEVAQPSVYAVHHCSHLPQLMDGYEVVDDLHVQLSPFTICNLHSNQRLHDFHFPFPFPSWVQLSCCWNGQPH